VRDVTFIEILVFEIRVVFIMIFILIRIAFFTMVFLRVFVTLSFASKYNKYTNTIVQ